MVDSGSTDDTCEIARSYDVQLITMAKDDFTYGRALNLGFAAAETPVVACLSAHALPMDRHWLRNLIRPLAGKRVCAVVGKTLPHADCNPFDRRGLLRQYGTESRFVTDGTRPGFSNANSAVRRAVWEKHPFDEALTYAEDVCWARQRQGERHAIVYAADAVVFHSHNETPAQLKRRFWAESRAREKLDPRHRPYRLRALGWDLLAGTAYDLWTAARTKGGRRWFWRVLPRRWAINVGRYAGSRGMILPPGGSIAGLWLRRQWLRFWRFAGSLASRLAPWLVVATRKHGRPIHPKHLLPERAEHFWYSEHLAGGERALDVGCNVGAHTKFAARQGLAVCGMDVDERSLEHARFLLRWEGSLRAMVLRADADARFPFADGAFDRAMVFDIIEHVKRPDHLLAEVRRVLADEGLLLLTAPNAETSWKRRCREAGLPFFADPTHLREYTHAGLCRTLGEAGFEVLEETPIVSDTPWAPWYDLLGGLSLRLYEKLADRKRAQALQNPGESSGVRVVARKVKH